MSRALPNLIITGTPGTGKTSHCELLAERTGLKHVSVNQVVKDRECHEGWDDEFQSWVVDEDKVRSILFTHFFGFRSHCFFSFFFSHFTSLSIHACIYGWLDIADLMCLRQLLDAIEDEVKQGGCIIDWHACDLFPKSWIDLVVVLRVDTATLYDRLTAR